VHGAGAPCVPRPARLSRWRGGAHRRTRRATRTGAAGRLRPDASPL